MDTKKLTEPADGEPEFDPRSLVPLPRLAFQVLLALARSDNHGYAIAKEVGLDLERLEEDMRDPAFTEHLRQTLTLASEIGATGTHAIPGFPSGTS